MHDSLLVETLQRVRCHPWWQARARLAMAVLRNRGILPPAKVFDVGCGWGVNLLALESAGYDTIGLDVSRSILERIDRPNRRLIEADLTQELPTELEHAAAILVLDVIEHADDDQGFLRRAGQLLSPGGLAVVSVPARPDLFSEFDRIQGHRRRYLPESLGAAFVSTGLEVKQVFWWGGWMVPLFRLRAVNWSRNSGEAKCYADYLRVPRWPIPSLMKLFYDWEQSRAISGKLKTGTSLFAIATRQQ
jgi:SAM-dependent methyltransferase